MKVITFFPDLINKENLLRWDKWHNFFRRCMSFLRPNQHTEKKQSIDSNQWPGSIISSSTTGLLTKGATLSDASRPTITTVTGQYNNTTKITDLLNGSLKPIFVFLGRKSVGKYSCAFVLPQWHQRPWAWDNFSDCVQHALQTAVHVATCSKTGQNNSSYNAADAVVLVLKSLQQEKGSQQEPHCCRSCYILSHRTVIISVLT